VSLPSSVSQAEAVGARTNVTRRQVRIKAGFFIFGDYI